MSLLAPWMNGLTGAGLADGRIDGRNVLETYSPVFAAQGAYTTGTGEGSMDYAAQGPQFNSAVSGVFDQSFADREGFGDLWRSGYSGGGGYGDDRTDASYSPELLDRLSQYQVARLGFGDDMRQFAVMRDGQVVSATEPRAYRDAFKGEFLPAAAALIGGAAMNGAFAGVGEGAAAATPGWSSGVTFGAGDAGASGLSGLSGGGLSGGFGGTSFAAPAWSSGVTFGAGEAGSSGLSGTSGGLSGGSGSSSLGGLLSGISERAPGALKWLMDNPRLLATIGGGLLGGVGGGGGAPQEPVGPAKQWKSPLQTGLMTQPELTNVAKPVSFKGRW